MMACGWGLLGTGELPTRLENYIWSVWLLSYNAVSQREVVDRAVLLLSGFLKAGGAGSHKTGNYICVNQE